jgi:hypothetical protein
MFKISIVMLTTTFFAGMLIADRHESLSVAASGRTIVAANHPAGAQVEVLPISGRVVVRQDDQSVKTINMAAVDPSTLPQQRTDKKGRRRFVHHIRTA